MNRYKFIKNEKVVRVELVFGVFSGDRYEMKNIDGAHLNFHKLTGYPINLVIDAYDKVRNVFTFNDYPGTITPLQLEAGYDNIKKSKDKVSKIQSAVIQGPPSWPKNQHQEEDDIWGD